MFATSTSALCHPVHDSKYRRAPNLAIQSTRRIACRGLPIPFIFISGAAMRVMLASLARARALVSTLNARLNAPCAEPCSSSSADGVPCAALETTITQPKLAVRQTSGQTPAQTNRPLLSCLLPHRLRGRSVDQVTARWMFLVRTSCTLRHRSVTCSPAGFSGVTIGGQACGAAGEVQLHGHVRGGVKYACFCVAGSALQAA